MQESHIFQVNLDYAVVMASLDSVIIYGCHIVILVIKLVIYSNILIIHTSKARNLIDKMYLQKRGFFVLFSL